MVVGILALLGGCGSDDASDLLSAPASPPADEGGRPGCAKGDPCRVNREQFGQQWPYTVDRGVLSCETVEPSDDPVLDSRDALLLEANGKTYALNIPALRVAEKNGWESSQEIEDPNSSAMSFLLFGLRICA